MDLITPDLLVRWFGGVLTISALLFLMLYILRRWQARGGELGNVKELLGQPRPQRLKVLESRWLDAKHRAVLLQADGTEHLILIGGNQPVELNK